MNLTITNFRGIAQAAFDLTGIVLVGGPNAAGKSSVAQATAAALTGNPLPIRGMKSSQAGCLVRSGAAKGSVVATGTAGEITIDWPKAKATTTGQPPTASEIAAGLCCVLNLPAKERAEVLGRYLKADPTMADLDAALADLSLPAASLEKIWQAIQAQGWDGAHKAATEKGAQLKGAWREVTGEQHGAKKAPEWLPEGWADDLAAADEKQLQQAVANARAEVENRIANAAISADRRKELEERAGQLKALEQQFADAGKLRDDMAAFLNEARQELAALPSTSQINSLSCPHCHKTVAMVNGALMKAADRIPEKEIEERRSARQAVQDKIVAGEQDFSRAVTALADVARRLEEAEAAKKELAKPTTGGGNPEEAREALALAETRLKAAQRKLSADHKHASIEANQKIADALDRDGVRLTKLTGALAAFNTKIAEVCWLAGWKPVAVDKELDASYGGTPYHLLSKSERWRARVALQLGMSALDGSQFVIIDGADILVDRALRNGLFRVLQTMGVPALVTMALPEPEALPDLAKAGVGTSYWVKDGVLIPRAEVAA
jgi:hypothetical protein